MAKTEQSTEKKFYDSEELQEFKEIILKKIDEAKKNLELLTAAVANAGNDVNDTLQSKEILILTEDTDAYRLSFIGIIRKRKILRDESVAQLVDASGKDASLLVSGHRSDHLRNQCCSHQGKIDVDRIHDLNSEALRSIPGQTEKI
jgi:hypothetical protein